MIYIMIHINRHILKLIIIINIKCNKYIFIFIYYVYSTNSFHEPRMHLRLQAMCDSKRAKFSTFDKRKKKLKRKKKNAYLNGIIRSLYLQ